MKCLPGSCRAVLISSTFSMERRAEACLPSGGAREEGREVELAVQWAGAELSGCAIITSANCKKSPPPPDYSWPVDGREIVWGEPSLLLGFVIHSELYQDPPREYCHQVMWWWRIIRTRSSRILEYLCCLVSILSIGEATVKWNIISLRKDNIDFIQRQLYTCCCWGDTATYNLYLRQLRLDIWKT